MRITRRALVALLPLSVSVLSVAACGTTAPQAGAAYGASPSASATAGKPATDSGDTMIPAKSELLVEKTSAGYVLATSSGRTVYWYSKDVKGSGKSACAAACLQAWPAVKGAPSAAPAVKLAGTLGTIKSASGGSQVTYDGYPLYTYVGDTAAAQVTGNDSGGVWHVFSGSQVSADPSAAASASAKVVSGASQAASPSSSASRSSSSGSGW